jgi:hypothetical protein
MKFKPINDLERLAKYASPEQCGRIIRACEEIEGKKLNEKEMKICGGKVVAKAAFVRGRATYQCEKCGAIYYRFRKHCNKEIKS